MENRHLAPAPLGAIAGRRVLTADGIVDARFDIERGCLAASGSPAPRSAGACFDAGDMLVLPGIVDIHGDAFERAVMPRPGVAFPYPVALLDVDRQLLAHGITTEFHGVTVSWEGGLRGDASALRMFEALEGMRASLGAEHYVHLRFETHHLDGVEAALGWMAAGKVRLLALNDHLPGMLKRSGDERKMLQYAERAECDVPTFRERLQRAAARAGEVPAAVSRLIDGARQAGLQIASHDDPDRETRQHYHREGCAVAEFPLTVEVARAARQLRNFTVFGAPNVIRGGSHTGAPNATEMVDAGLCDVLASDYYYPAPLQAAFRLVQLGVRTLPEAWALVSRNPALAAGLRDRGELAQGMRADAVVIDDRQPGLPRVCAAIVGGVLRHASAPLDPSRLGSTDTAGGFALAA